jgi:TM2 domain-containing membrane protein YozV
MKITELLFFFILLTSVNPAQTIDFDFSSPTNIRKFADYLFCDRDYLRAAIEYERLISSEVKDTLLFKIALSYSIIGDYPSAIKYFENIPSPSSYVNEAKLELIKTHYLMNDYYGVRSFYNNTFIKRANKYQLEGNKLFNFSYLFTKDELPSKEEFLSPFNLNEKDEVSQYYDWKQDPPYKNSTISGMMSAIIPGSGKIYVGEIGDGIVAFITTTVFAFIAYDNFNAGHNTRGWIWTGIAALFYGGNIYGSVAAAQVHNAKITFEFNDGLNVFLQKNNYYTPTYDFCNEK